MRQGPELTPGLGFSWYFQAAGFQEWALASQSLLLVASGIVTLPLALVLHHRPLLLVILQLIAISALQPYPSLTEPALYQVCPVCRTQYGLPTCEM